MSQSSRLQHENAVLAWVLRTPVPVFGLGRLAYYSQTTANRGRFDRRTAVM
jgi:hypothetical protein